MRPFALASAGILLCNACSGPSSASIDSLDTRSPAHVALITELHRLQERGIWRDPPPVHVDQIEFAELSSAVVPELRYHYATYHPPEISHGSYYVVAGERRGRIEILRDAADWGVLTRDWRPSSPEDASRACLELINAVGHDHEPLSAANRRERDSALVADLTSIVPSTDLRRMRMALSSPAEAEHRRGYASWRVRVWVAQRSSTTWMRQYQCSLPGNENVGPGLTGLSVVDSLRGGFPGR